MNPDKMEIFTWQGWIGKKWTKIVITRRQAIVTRYNPSLHLARFDPGSVGYEQAKRYIREGMFLAERPERLALGRGYVKA